MSVRLFDIQRYALHDGPGIRTILFFKGCPLKCAWCANPESQNYNFDVFIDESKCIACGACKESCPQNLENLFGEGCINCFSCVMQCHAKCLELVGKDYKVEDVIKIVERDRISYLISGGGVTFSGGEPLYQGKALQRLAIAFKKRGINTTIETCGYSSFENVDKAFAVIDTVLYDIKHMDPGVSKEFIGKDNHLILSNLKLAAQKYSEKITIRVPLIKGVNTSQKNLNALKQFMLENGLKRVDFLPYHRLGENKYKKLSRNIREGFETPSKVFLHDLCVNFAKSGIDAKLFG